MYFNGIWNICSHNDFNEHEKDGYQFTYLEIIFKRIIM